MDSGFISLVPLYFIVCDIKKVRVIIHDNHNNEEEMYMTGNEISRRDFHSAYNSNCPMVKLIGNV